MSGDSLSTKHPNSLFLLAGDPGFEPGLTESESGVLPLDKSPIGYAEKALRFILLGFFHVNKKQSTLSD